MNFALLAFAIWLAVLLGYTLERRGRKVAVSRAYLKGYLAACQAITEAMRQELERSNARTAERNRDLQITSAENARKFADHIERQRGNLFQ